MGISEGSRTGAHPGIIIGWGAPRDSGTDIDGMASNKGVSPRGGIHGDFGSGFNPCQEEKVTKDTCCGNIF